TYLAIPFITSCTILTSWLRRDGESSRHSAVAFPLCVQGTNTEVPSCQIISGSIWRQTSRGIAWQATSPECGTTLTWPCPWNGKPVVLWRRNTVQLRPFWTSLG